MAAPNLRSEERIGLIIALAAHVALVAVLVLRPPAPAPLPVPERMTVTLSEDVALTSTSPQPAAQPAPDEAPTLGETSPPAPVVQPQPAPNAAPPPLPKPVARVTPRVPTPVAPARATSKQAAKPAAQPSAPATPPRRPPAAAGGSRIGNDFLKGVGGARTTGTSSTQPAANAGPQVRANLAQSVLRQVRPNWQGRVPQGVNTDKIVTILSIELNQDGSLVKRPTVVRQEGLDDSNRAQAQRHAEEAIRAVQLSAPFDLPVDLYSTWRNLPPLRFRKTV